MDLIAYGSAALGAVKAVTQLRSERVDLADCSIRCEALRFSYEQGRKALHGVDPVFLAGGFTAFVGGSGCGTRTVRTTSAGKGGMTVSPTGEPHYK